MIMRVLYQFNENYAPFAGVSITSLFENNKKHKIVVYILGENISKSSCDKLLKLAHEYNNEMVFKDTSIIIEMMKKNNFPSYRGSYAANLRLFLTYFLEDDVEKVLYLDADTIIDDSIEDLYEIDMGNAPVAMALDSLGYRHKLEIGMRKSDLYYNSGVILFNLKNWRKRKLTESIERYIKDNNVNFPSPDQDLINIVCKDMILCLPPKYNMQPVHLVFSIDEYFFSYPMEFYYTKEDLLNSLNEVKIYHFFRFLGEFPWDKSNCHPDRELYEKYMQNSLWNDYKVRGKKKTIVNFVEKRLYLRLPRGVFLWIFSKIHNFYIKNKSETRVG